MKKNRVFLLLISCGFWFSVAQCGRKKVNNGCNELQKKKDDDPFESNECKKNQALNKQKEQFLLTYVTAVLFTTPSESFEQEHGKRLEKLLDALNQKKALLERLKQLLEIALEASEKITQAVDRNPSIVTDRLKAREDFEKNKSDYCKQVSGKLIATLLEREARLGINFSLEPMEKGLLRNWAVSKTLGCTLPLIADELLVLDLRVSFEKKTKEFPAVEPVKKVLKDLPLMQNIKKISAIMEWGDAMRQLEAKKLLTVECARETWLKEAIDEIVRILQSQEKVMGQIQDDCKLFQENKNRTPITEDRENLKKKKRKKKVLPEKIKVVLDVGIPVEKKEVTPSPLGNQGEPKSVSKDASGQNPLSSGEIQLTNNSVGKSEVGVSTELICHDKAVQAFWPEQSSKMTQTALVTLASIGTNTQEVGKKTVGVQTDIPVVEQKPIRLSERQLPVQKAPTLYDYFNFGPDVQPTPQLCKQTVSELLQILETKKYVFETIRVLAERDALRLSCNQRALDLSVFYDQSNPYETLLFESGGTNLDEQELYAYFNGTYRKNGQQRNCMQKNALPGTSTFCLSGEAIDKWLKKIRAGDTPERIKKLAALLLDFNRLSHLERLCEQEYENRIRSIDLVQTSWKVTHAPLTKEGKKKFTKDWLPVVGYYMGVAESQPHYAVIADQQKLINELNHEARRLV